MTPCQGGSVPCMLKNRSKTDKNPKNPFFFFWLLLPQDPTVNCTFRFYAFLVATRLLIFSKSTFWVVMKKLMRFVFQVSCVVIWHLRPLWNDHHSNSSNHLSSYEVIQILLTIFLMLYIPSWWLLHFLTGSLCLLIPCIYFALSHLPLPCFFPSSISLFSFYFGPTQKAAVVGRLTEGELCIGERWQGSCKPCPSSAWELSRVPKVPKLQDVSSLHPLDGQVLCMWVAHLSCPLVMRSNLEHSFQSALKGFFCSLPYSYQL